MTKKAKENIDTATADEATIPTVTIAAVEYERLKAKAEMYDLICGISQANQRIAMLEQCLFKNV